MTNIFWRTLWYFTPAKSIVVDKVTPEMSVTEERPSVYISKLGHIVLGIIYSFMVFGYAALLVYNWWHRDSYTEFSQQRSEDFGPMQMQLYTYCTNPPFCGNITIRVNYSESSLPGCTSQPDVVITGWQSGEDGVGKLNGTLVPLCFSGNPLFNTHFSPLLIQGVTVEFSAINPGQNQYNNWTNWTQRAQGVVEVLDRTPATALADPLPISQSRRLRLINMDTHQVKSLVVGQTALRDHGPITNRSGFPIGIQYDGKHPKWTGTFILAQHEVTDVTTIYKTGVLTIIGVMGTAAFAAWVVFVFMIVIMPVWPLIFPGPAQQVLNEKRKRMAKKSN